jgi:hypothetical protein
MAAYHVAYGSFSTDPADFACRIASASPRKPCLRRRLRDIEGLREFRNVTYPLVKLAG